MKRVDELISDDIKSIGIAGHVNPDGDCVGSCGALFLYLCRRYPRARVDLYLETPEQMLRGMAGAEEALSAAEEDFTYDLFIVCDVSDEDRIGVAGDLFRRARRTACIDHHVSNGGFADLNHIEPESSSCSEVLTRLMDRDGIDREIAESLYTGIIHDTGVFQYPNTTPETLRAAAFLIGRGVDFSGIIDRTFNARTFEQNRILGIGLSRLEKICGGLAVISFVTAEEMRAAGVTGSDVGIVVPSMRYTEGAEAAAFLYEKGENEIKVSLRSCSYLNVSEIASFFGGGGHVRAAGFTLGGSLETVKARVTDALERAFDRTDDH